MRTLNYKLCKLFGNYIHSLKVVTGENVPWPGTRTHGLCSMRSFSHVSHQCCHDSLSLIVVYGLHGWNFALEDRPRVWVPGGGSFSPVGTFKLCSWVPVQIETYVTTTDVLLDIALPQVYVLPVPRPVLWTNRGYSNSLISISSCGWTFNGGLWADSTNDSRQTTFIVWPHGRTQLNTFLEHLNGLCQKIHFTMEIEEKSWLPFLDVLAQRNDDNLTTLVYWKKKTHTTDTFTFVFTTFCILSQVVAHHVTCALLSPIHSASTLISHNLFCNWRRSYWPKTKNLTTWLTLKTPPLFHFS